MQRRTDMKGRATTSMFDRWINAFLDKVFGPDPIQLWLDQHAPKPK
jgi:hypothetical protein